MSFTAETKMGELLDDPKAREVLLKHLPEIATAGPMLNMARGMTLKAVAAFPQAKISAEKLQTIVADLANV
jgi:hypothetical protein